VLRQGSGGADGYRNNLLLEHHLKPPIIVDASTLGPCHPMFVVRLRLFIDWHLAAGREVRFVPPDDAVLAQHLDSMGLTEGLPASMTMALPSRKSSSSALLPIRRLVTHNDVEDVSLAATEALGQLAREFVVWSDPVYMAVSELCSNALQHGRDALGAYVAADRIEGESRLFRLAIADLGIGIPEHIRAHHPEWQDDTAAIVRALQRGVSGTGDPQRGNGFAEVLDDAMKKLLVRAKSAVELDIRSSKGRVVVDLLDGRQDARAGRVENPRRGTWITYTVTAV